MSYLGTVWTTVRSLVGLELACANLQRQAKRCGSIPQFHRREFNHDTSGCYPWHPCRGKGGEQRLCSLAVPIWPRNCVTNSGDRTVKRKAGSGRGTAGSCVQDELIT